MFKERSTQKLIEYIQTLPDPEQKRIVQEISNIEQKGAKKKTARRKLSSLKGKVTKTSGAKVDSKIKTLRDEWQRDI
jgi:hypothetical protein